jgi:hypothetical protein
VEFGASTEQGDETLPDDLVVVDHEERERLGRLVRQGRFPR